MTREQAQDIEDSLEALVTLATSIGALSKEPNAQADLEHVRMRYLRHRIKFIGMLQCFFGPPGAP